MIRPTDCPSPVSGTNPLKFHVWLPDFLSSKGGIQAFSTYLVKALESLYPTSSLSVFSKHDRAIPSHLHDQSRMQFHCAGAYPHPVRTAAFAAQLLSHGILQHPDLAIATHLNFTVAAHKLKQLTGIPYWAVAHGVDAWNITKPQLQQAIRHADRILAVSNYTRDRLLKEQNLDPARVGLLPNTFDANRFQIAPKSSALLRKYNLTSDQPIILTVCRLSAAEGYKGYDKILAALPAIRRVIPNVHYMIVGQGDDQLRIECLITEKKLRDCVTLTGFVSDAELCDYYNLCDVFAMPSKGEGFGIVYLEAMGCGKPVVGGHQDGSVDALCGGKLGALVNPDDVNQIAQILIQLLQGNYPNRLLYQPEQLRQAVIHAFGFERFKAQLHEQLEKSFFKHPDIRGKTCMNI